MVRYQSQCMRDSLCDRASTWDTRDRNLDGWCVCTWVCSRAIYIALAISPRSRCNQVIPRYWPWYWTVQYLGVAQIVCNRRICMIPSNFSHSIKTLKVISAILVGSVVYRLMERKTKHALNSNFIDELALCYIIKEAFDITLYEPGTPSPISNFP